MEFGLEITFIFHLVEIECSNKRWFFNIFVVWFLTGFWHGASFNFIVWGLYFGFILVLEKVFLIKFLEKIPNLFNHIYVLFIVINGFVLFEINGFLNIFKYFNAMFNLNNFVDKEFFYYLIPNIILIIFSVLGSTPLIKNIIYKNNYLKTIVLILGLVLSTSFLVDASFNPFLYFRF